MTKLYVMNGAQQGQSYALQGKRTTLGRSSDNDIQIKEDHLSRKHLKIIRKGNRCFIVDLGSTNGTLLNVTMDHSKYRLVNSNGVLRFGEKDYLEKLFLLNVIH